MEFNCAAFGGTTCWTGGVCLANGSCAACSPGWQHQRGVVWNDDCMAPTAFFGPMLGVETVCAVVCLALLAWNHAKFQRTIVIVAHRHEERQVCALVVGLVFSTWGMVLCIYLGTVQAVYPWLVVGQVATAQVDIHVIKRKLLAPAYGMFPHVARTVRHFDVGLLGTSMGILLFNAAFTCVGAAVERRDLFNVGETMQLMAMSLTALVSLGQIRWLAYKIHIETTKIANGGSGVPSSAHSAVVRARSRIDYIGRVAGPVSFTCIGSLALCAVSFELGTIPFVDVWICVAVTGSMCLFTAWHLMIFRPKPSAAAASDSLHNSSKPQEALAPLPTPQRLSKDLSSQGASPTPERKVAAAI